MRRAGSGELQAAPEGSSRKALKFAPMALY